MARKDAEIEQKVKDNIRLVPYILKDMRNIPEVRDDRDWAESCALWGLYKAARTYNPTVGKFSTYAAVCIKREILREVAQYCRAQKRDSRRTRVSDKVGLRKSTPAELPTFEGHGRLPELLNCLTPGQRRVVEEHFGLYAEPKTLAQLGRELRITRNGARTRLTAALARMQRYAEQQRLELQDNQVIRAGA